MSHSQFHSIKSFILTHAWLNLWDKHMTTGRINQVTIVFLLSLSLPFSLPLSLSLPFTRGREKKGKKKKKKSEKKFQKKKKEVIHFFFLLLFLPIFPFANFFLTTNKTFPRLHSISKIKKKKKKFFFFSFCFWKWWTFVASLWTLGPFFFFFFFLTKKKKEKKLYQRHIIK